MSPAAAPHRLGCSVLDKVWGTAETEPWHHNPERRQVGEVWFAPSDGTSLLVKLLFTSANLSVQVHPDDAYAAEHHKSRGKTEMWHVLRAEPGAKIALGLKHPISSGGLRQAALSGKIMDLLAWIPVQAGQTYFTPAGTIHALGGGLAICEVQQLSDVTYRLYDYGRDRELHLDHGVKVSRCHSHEGLCTPHPVAEGRELLVDCDHFRTERLSVRGSLVQAALGQDSKFVALTGSGTFAGEEFAPGMAWHVPSNVGGFEIESTDATFLIASEPLDH